MPDIPTTDGALQARIGQSTPRLDGRLKVIGAARYAADTPVGSPAYAYLVTSAIALGRILRMSLDEARAVPGVLDIMTWENTRDAVKAPELFSKGGYASSTIVPLTQPEIRHDGEIIAVVLADTFEAAREGAHKVVVDYAEQQPAATFDSTGASVETVMEEPKVGDAEAAYHAAPVKLDQNYSTPTQHHNPIELFTTTCVWNGDHLTIYEPSQFMYGLKNGVAEQLGIDPDNVRTVSQFVGGAFGSKGAVTSRTALIAVAAKRLNRPVKLVATRDQGFTIATYRAETRQRVKLAATSDGKLQALVHEGWEVTSRPDPYKVAGTSTTARIYACPNVATKVSIVHADRSTPGFMRSPPELPYMFALESAMDELAVALNMDPIELRRINDTQVEPIKQLPYTSRSLMQCFDTAAEKFGWQQRTTEPRSMRDGDWLIGWGCATSCYPTHIGPAAVRVILYPNGRVRVQTAGHEIGTGAYTAIALTAADRLGVSVDAVDVELGDSELPPAPVAGGSNNTASICNCVAQACRQIADRLIRAAIQSNGSPFAGRDAASLSLIDHTLRGGDGQNENLADAIARASYGVIEEYAETKPEGTPPDAIKKLYAGHATMVGGAEGKQDMRFAFGAEFVEVRVHEQTGEIRVPRIVGAFAAGEIVNPTTARSQLMGGLIWGISAALHEATEIDPRTARFVNANLSEYLIPVNADIDQVEVLFVPETDTKINELGIKGLGELGNVGTNAAVANAVYHATGRRIRDLPIRLDALI